MAQHLEALKLANHRQTEGAKQRDALIGSPVREVVAALVKPTEELACLRLRVLFLVNQNRTGPIPRLASVGFNRALRSLGERSDGTTWDAELRLRDLTEMERRRLVRALIAEAPGPWKAAA